MRLGWCSLAVFGSAKGEGVVGKKGSALLILVEEPDSVPACPLFRRPAQLCRTICFVSLVTQARKPEASEVFPNHSHEGCGESWAPYP